ncbi:lysozyme [Roseomonas sp. USHLN139]|uniref:lysozyme n=1 Tax=Roseomonas sp. USHLN139 TaxID=3081298 RepID=UPI003B013DB4
MTWLERIFALLGMGREADPAVGTALTPLDVPPPAALAPGPLPGPGQVTASSAGIPVSVVGEAPRRAVTYIPPAATTLLHHYESCAAKRPDGMIAPYLDAASIPTIGWGNTRYADGRRVSMADKPITQAEADALFTEVLAGFSQEVLALLPATVDDDAHAAFLSFAYNVGVPGFAGSTALRRFMAGDRKGAASALELWDKAGGKVLKGLQRRRRAEKLVLLGATADSAIAVALRDFP